MTGAWGKGSAGAGNRPRPAPPPSGPGQSRQDGRAPASNPWRIGDIAGIAAKKPRQDTQARIRPPLTWFIPAYAEDPQALLHSCGGAAGLLAGACAFGT